MWLLNDRQPVFPAKVAGGFSQMLLLCFGIVILAAVPKGHGIEAEMAVQMLLAQMGGDDDLKAVAPHLLRQLHADFVGKLRRDLLRLETLIPVPSDIAVRLAIALLGEYHLPQCRFFQAVDGGDILALLCGLRALYIGKHIVEVLQLRRFRRRLFRVLNIVDKVFQAAFDVPKGSRCH